MQLLGIELEAKTGKLSLRYSGNYGQGVSVLYLCEVRANVSPVVNVKASNYDGTDYPDEVDREFPDTFCEDALSWLQHQREVAKDSGQSILAAHLLKLEQSIEGMEKCKP